MGKTMYYDNLLISDLMDGDHLEHHGVLGMKWGIRRYQSYSQVPRKSGEGGKEQGLAKKKSKLEAKKAKNNTKITKARAELAKPKSQKQIAKERKYMNKAAKIDRSVITRGARQLESLGGSPGPLGLIQIARSNHYHGKIAKARAKTEKYEAKIADLSYKNTKLDSKIRKIDTKIKMSNLKEDVPGKARISKVGGASKINYTDGSTGYNASTHIKSTNGTTIYGDMAGGFGKTKKQAQLDSDIRAYKSITKNNNSGRTRNKSAQVKLEKSIRKRIGNDEAFDRIINAKTDKERHSEMYDAGVWGDRKRR